MPGASPTSRCRRRGCSPKLPRDLETICLKCLEKEPARRYASALELAEDLRRFQEGRSIVARPVGSAEHLRKWVKRQPAVAALLAVSGVALVAGVVGLGAVAGIQARANGQLRKANEATNQALAETTKAQAETRAALAQSEESRQQAEGVSEFLVEAFRSPDPAQTGREVKVADVLDRASDRLDKGFAGSQATKGALLDALGRTYRGLGLYDRAVSLHTKARTVREAGAGPRPPRHARQPQQPRHRLPGGRPDVRGDRAARGTLKLRESKLGPDHPDTLKSRNNLANAYWSAGRNAEAIALHEETLKLRESKLGPDHPDTLRAATTWPSPTGPPAGCRGDRAVSRRRSSCGRRSWAPTTPTRSRAATTWPSPTGPPAGSPRRSRSTRRRSSSARPSSAPTTPTRSPAATTWPSPTPGAGRLPRRSRSTRRRSSSGSRSWAPTTPTRS